MQCSDINPGAIQKAEPHTSTYYFNTEKMASV